MQNVLFAILWLQKEYDLNSGSDNNPPHINKMYTLLHNLVLTHAFLYFVRQRPIFPLKQQSLIHL